MPYGRTTSRRRRSTARGRSVSGYSRVRSGSGLRARRSSARRRSTAGGTRTVRLVIEQAAPSVAPVVTEEGRFAVPDRSVPKRAKF